MELCTDQSVDFFICVDPASKFAKLWMEQRSCKQIRPFLGDYKRLWRNLKLYHQNSIFVSSSSPWINLCSSWYFHQEVIISHHKRCYRNSYLLTHTTCLNMLVGLEWSFMVITMSASFFSSSGLFVCNFYLLKKGYQRETKDNNVNVTCN